MGKKAIVRRGRQMERTGVVSPEERGQAVTLHFANWGLRTGDRESVSLDRFRDCVKWVWVYDANGNMAKDGQIAYTGTGDGEPLLGSVGLGQVSSIGGSATYSSESGFDYGLNASVGIWNGAGVSAAWSNNGGWNFGASYSYTRDGRNTGIKFGANYNRQTGNVKGSISYYPTDDDDEEKKSGSWTVLSYLNSVFSTPAEQAAAKQQGTAAGNGEVKPSQSAHRLTLAPPRSELEYGLQFDTSGLNDHPPLLSSHADLSPSFGLSPYRPGSAPGLQWNPQATPSKASAGPSFDAKMNISFKVSGVSPAASQGDVLDFGGSSISGTNIASIHMQFNDQVVSAQFGSSGTTTWQCQDKEQIYTRVAISGAGAVGAMVVIGGGGKLLVAASPYIYLYGGSAAIVAQNLNYRLAAWQPLANTVDKFILYYPNSPPLRRDVAGLAFGMLDFADGLLSPNPPPPTLWGMTGHVARKGVDQVNDYLVQELGL